MTITEANAVNTLLQHAYGPPHVALLQDRQLVGEAAETLARNAHKALHAGLTGEKARELVLNPLGGHFWTGKPGALCSCGWAETSNIHGIHEDWRRHVEAVLSA